MLMISSGLLRGCVTSYRKTGNSADVPVVINGLAGRNELLGVDGTRVGRFRHGCFAGGMRGSLHSGRRSEGRVPIILLSSEGCTLAGSRGFACSLRRFPNFGILIYSEPRGVPCRS